MAPNLTPTRQDYLDEQERLFGAELHAEWQFMGVLQFGTGRARPGDEAREEDREAVIKLYRRYLGLAHREAFIRPGKDNYDAEARAAYEDAARERVQLQLQLHVEIVRACGDAANCAIVTSLMECADRAAHDAGLRGFLLRHARERNLADY